MCLLVLNGATSIRNSTPVLESNRQDLSHSKKPRGGQAGRCGPCGMSCMTLAPSSFQLCHLELVTSSHGSRTAGCSPWIRATFWRGRERLVEEFKVHANQVCPSFLSRKTVAKWTSGYILLVRTRS